MESHAAELPKPSEHSQRRSTLIAAAAGVGAIAVSLFFRLPVIGHSIAADVVQAMPSVAWVATGTFILDQPRTRQLGQTMIMCGLLWSATWIGVWEFQASAWLATILYALFWFVAAWGVLGYPTTLSRGRSERVFLISFAVQYIAVQTVINMTARPEWIGFHASAWWYAPFASHRALNDTYNVMFVFLVLCAIEFAIAVALRIRRMTSLDRSVAIPMVAGFCIQAIDGALTVGTAIYLPPTPAFIFALGVTTVPLGFLVAELRVRLQSSSTAEVLHDRFSGSALTIDMIQTAVRDALQTSSLEVFVWSESDNSYVDCNGTIKSPYKHTDDKFIREVPSRSGSNLAVISADISLANHKRIVNTAVGASAVAIENALLHADLLNKVYEINQSRQRIATAGIEERQRIERDLHDGVQQGLLATSARLGIISRESSNEKTRNDLAAAQRDLQATLADLRDLAHGLSPAELRQFGIKSAVATLQERLPLQISSSVTESRFSSAIEATAYFVMCEGLTNVLNHSNSTFAEVDASEAESVLAIRVADSGSRSTTFAFGHGLTGLKDRVESIGGEFKVEHSDQGVTLNAWLPIVD